MLRRLVLALAVPTLVISALACPTLAFAQPDAGVLYQQIEREKMLPLPSKAAPEKPAVPPAPKPVEGVSVTVKAFRLIGNTLLSEAQINAALAEYLNRPLDFAQLQDAAAAVARHYRDAGWIVRTTLPPQEVAEGIVTIQVVEAVFGTLHLEGAPVQRVHTDPIRRVFEALQQPGAPLSAKALDRALLLADDLPGIQVTSRLAPGANDRETDIILKLTDEPLIAGGVTLDDTGARSTGAERLSAELNLASPFGRGDLASAQLIHSEGNDYVRLAYSLPVGGDGWRIGANASTLEYQLVGADFAALNARGSSDSLGIEANYPLHRSHLSNLYLALNYDDKGFDNQSGGATTTRYRIESTTIGLSGNLIDSLGTVSTNTAHLSLTFGERHNEIGTTDDSFTKLRYGLSRQQGITPELSFHVALSGQESNDTLDSSEKFYLGGAQGVRAYPVSEGAGSSGVLANLELRWQRPQGVTLTAFHDAGRIRNNDASANYGLKGYGLALGWQAPNGVNLKATWARRIGNNPNPTSEGKDQDGSLDLNRFWLQATLPF